METNVQRDLSSYIGRVLRDHFGKGPESVFVTLGHTFITCYLRNFLSPMERVLLEQDQIVTILQTRDLLMKNLLPEITAYLKIATGVEIREVYYDWGLHNRSGIIVALTSEPLPHAGEIAEAFTGKEQLHEEIEKISIQVEKIPEEMFSYKLNMRTILVVRNGILVAIEKEFIRLGFSESLRIAKRQLEKGMLHNDLHFESILGTKVVDLFVDWDFGRDKSVIVFIVNPTS
ncbi:MULTISPECIES: DUF2294 domain-containing protein [Brevibacillus]|uniref:Na+-translocating membrane potential-generating system MpsC domain-containing protein n=1 Tax=Brevibacillus borstelensis AK1 TaxID=1300222 RepID=M8E635_9BACL|nr:Na-translocating system protein MpsC family protein [Brevibacillus borstelensis]EMT50920.1 hypothetical protein I532_19981 [Brevibacillus borstelensis AK1]KKX53679.1 hypothetical protein X546_18685 [Brevibacillus borstelensis cifa_chp40]MCM3622846.1 DUF2294 domain-containing protein [Brevibacillus borstelensis]MED2010234.1 Na-translocating system protein MpsC family protein [Brevibacillus borstelensis]